MFAIILTSCLLGFILAPLGCILLWRKYAYYSDGLAHASMLAVIVSLILNVNIVSATIFNGLLFAWLIYIVGKRSDNNAAIGLISSVMVSLALILQVMFPSSFDLHNLLFGEILLVQKQDIYGLVLILILVVAFISLYYHQLITIILSRDIAHLYKIRVKYIEMCFLVILSCAVIVSIKLVGALLVTSILIIPAMSARLISSSPLAMICNSILIIQFMNFVGVFLSISYDFPFAPSIVVGGGIIYLLMNLLTNSQRSRQ